MNLLLLLSALLSALSGVVVNDARGEAPVVRSRALAAAVSIVAPIAVIAPRVRFPVAPPVAPQTLAEPAMLRLAAMIPVFASRRRE